MEYAFAFWISIDFIPLTVVRVICPYIKSGGKKKHKHIPTHGTHTKSSKMLCWFWWCEKKKHLNIVGLMQWSVNSIMKIFDVWKLCVCVPDFSCVKGGDPCLNNNSECLAMYETVSREMIHLCVCCVPLSRSTTQAMPIIDAKQSMNQGTRYTHISGMGNRKIHYDIS